MKLANTTVDMNELWIKKAKAAKKRFSRRMMIPPNAVLNILYDLRDSNEQLAKLHGRLGETNFRNLLK